MTDTATNQENTMIKVYVSPGPCQPCNATKRWLDQNSVPYEVLEITADLVDDFRAQGMTSSPVVVTPEGQWCGFRPDLLRKLI